MATIASRLAELRSSRKRTLDALAGLTEAQLGLPAAWRGRQTDVRYMILRLADSDDERRIALGRTLETLGWRQPEAARILGGRLGHIRSLLVGLSDEAYSRKPAPAEWSIGQVLEHMRIVEERYLVQTEHAVERLRAPDLPMRVPDDLLPPIPAEPSAAPTVDEALARLEVICAAVNSRLSLLDDAALAAPTVWSGWTVDARFRLHRFGAHERQHAVQVAKSLQAVGWRPTEAQMILSLAEESRARLEGMLLGCPDDLIARRPDSLPSVETLLDEALADESSAQRIVAR